MLKSSRRAVAAAAVVLLAASGSAAAQNASSSPDAVRPVHAADKASPDWLTLGTMYRFRVESQRGIGYVDDRNDSYGLGRVLVDVGVKPTNWLKFHFRGQDSRAPGKQNANAVFRDSFDVRQAWVELGDSENGWIHGRVGRQELLYGAQRLLGPLNWTNTSRQFDAAKLTLGAKDLSVDLFASSLVIIDPDGFNRSGKGVDLHGAYANLRRFNPKGALEPFLLWKVNLRQFSEAGRAGRGDTYTAGFRFVRPLPGGFDFETEFARQFGSIADDDISAWGAYWILGYTVNGWKWTPRFSVEYQYGSGDSDPNDGKRGTFDQLFPTGHLYQGAADRVGWRNISDVRAGVQLKLHRKFNLKFDYFSFWLANKRDGLYAVNGKLAVPAPAGGAMSSHVGQELDLIFVYKPSSFTTFGAGIGHMFPGAFLKQNTPGSGYTFPYVFLNYVL